MKIYEILKEEYVNKEFVDGKGNVYRIAQGVGERFLTNEIGQALIVTPSLLEREFKLFKALEWFDEESINNRDKYYYIDECGGVGYHFYDSDAFDLKCIENVAAFKTIEKALEVQDEQLLYRKMKKFQEENDETVNWHDGSLKYKITYDFATEEYYTITNQTSKDLNSVYFTTIELAQRCIDKIIRPHITKGI